MNNLLILCVCFLTCIGQLCQKKAVNNWQGKIIPWHSKLLDAWIITAITSLSIGMLLWLQVLRLVPLNIAYPMLSFNFVLVALASHFFFGETANARSWIGIATIMLGVILLGMHV